MKCKTLLIACALSTAAFSFSAMASSNSICDSTLARVCTDTQTQRSEMNARTLKLKNEIAAEANRNAAPRIDEMKKQISKFHFIKRAIQSYKIRNQEIMKSAKTRIGGIESVVTNPENIAKLKGYMQLAIDQSNFDAATKANFKAIESTVMIGNFGDFLERTNLDDDVMSQLLGNACGSDGMVENAFATTISGQRYVLICPGFLISMSQNASDKDRFSSILQAIAHEMGHHIDNSKVGNDLYKPYLSCLSTNYADKFNKSADDKKLCEKNPKDVDGCNLKVATTHAGELIADQWGIKVTAIHAKQENLSFGETEDMLVNSWAKLCGTGDEGIHPTGDFRIGTLMRVNPAIAGALACNNSAIVKPACTLDGAVNL
ncbi:MAG: hypothetical protein H7177_02960 [Rhizobacter sp.]|nr:hypothetical protein [Bacteriovorax sp.]